ncbi:hypothetical protein PV761_03275 [Arthrobacter sp. CC3]|uniref:hypothetical protein n=1 Tax=Arthrobacter sp. CC3 TaxID=3029185 RepID=UPI00326535A3
MPQIINEVSAVGALTGSRQEITIITPGWGTSGYYSPAVLEKAAKDRAFPAKTQLHIDHDGEMARFEQPAGSVLRLAAGLTEDARWEPDWIDPDNPGEEPGRLVAEADVMPNWRDFLAAAKEYIGTSIAASATFTKGEVGGRKGNIIEAIHPHPLNRVDYVTKAGRGGRISAVLESALTRRLTEATANETRELIREALRAAYGYDGTWVWLRDHDDTTAWFEVEDADSLHIYEQTYQLTNDAVTLTGERVEVRATTQYIPVTQASEAATGNVFESIDLPQVGDRVVIDPDRLHDPAHNTGTIAEIGTTAYGLVMDGMPEMGVHRWYTADEFDYVDDPAMGVGSEAKKRRKKKKPGMPGMPGMKREAANDSPPDPAGVTENEKEPLMGTIQIEEADHRNLIEKSGRATALEAENADLKARLAESVKKDNDAAAAAVVAEAFQGITAPATVKLLAGTYTLTTEGAVDTAALQAKAEEAAAEIAASFGAGTVRGVGHTDATESKTITDDDVVNAL